MSTEPKRFAIMASGSGSNAQVLFDNVKKGSIPAEIACVFCDKPGAKVIERAEQAGIPVIVFSPKEFASKEAYESAIVREFQQRGVEHVVLAGYMRICGPAFLSAYAGKTINLHPSLLPMFPGKDAIGDALEAGVKYTGVTVHFIDEGMDTGPIIRQETVRIDASDTRDTLAPKIHAAEHRLLPDITAMLVSGKLRLEQGKVVLENGGN